MATTHCIAADSPPTLLDELVPSCDAAARHSLWGGPSTLNARRREVVRALLDPLAQRYGRPAADERAEIEAILYTLTSFETFDTLAGPRRSLEDVAPALLRLARAAIGTHLDP